MIIHHKEDFSKYKIHLLKKLQYSDTFTFIPLKIMNQNKKLETCILQTPCLFTPYGLQKTLNNKTIIDLSFLNKDNDKYCSQFLENLEDIFQTIKVQFSKDYTVNHFCKDSQYSECMRLKVDKSLFFNHDRQPIDSIDPFSYGNFLIHLHGLWINDNKVWFQWYLVQAKIIEPLSLQEYSFIDEIQETKSNEPLSKYDKMLKMGIPKEAVERQKQLDSINTSSNIPIPPPPPPNFKNTRNNIPEINAEDLQNVVLKKGKPIKNKQNKEKNNDNVFEPPSLEELQITLSKLKKIN